MLNIVYFVSILIGAGFCLAPIGYFVLGPINRVVTDLHAPSRFQLVDFFWLLFQWQILLAICVSFVGIEHTPFFVALLAAGSIVVVALWSGAVSFISRAGISCALRRAVFVVLLLPATLALMVGGVGTVVGVFTMPIVIQEEGRLTWGHYGLVFAAIPLIFAAAYLLRSVSLWILGGLRIGRISA